jgi:hypothetical protein
MTDIINPVSYDNKTSFVTLLIKFLSRKYNVYIIFGLGDSVCNRRLEESVGWFASPNFPSLYPQHSSCSWVIHKQVSSF